MKEYHLSKLDYTRPSFHEEIENNLETHRSGFVKSKFSDEELVKGLDEAKIILEVVKTIQFSLFDFFETNPSLVSVFDRQFLPFKEFISREFTLEVCFLEDFLFPEKELYPLAIHDQFDEEMIRPYVEAFEDWCKDVLAKHESTEKHLDEDFSVEIRPSELDCRCNMCMSVYRTKLRDTVFFDCKSLIDEIYEELKESEFDEDINYYSDLIFDLKRKLNKNLHSVRYRFKTATLKKLDLQITSYMREMFNYKSEVTQKYVEKLKLFLQEQLRRQGLKRDLVNDAEMARFFQQKGLEVWKNERYLEREFSKLVKSVLSLKRKDISAKILLDYLGEFWMHLEARKTKRRVIYHKGPTNSGKTYHAIQALSQAKSGCYLAPLRLLAGELYDTLNEKGVKTTLLTGEEVIDTPGATHFSSTIEMVKLSEEFECVVIDEIQMITDSQRGWAWTRALVGVNCPEVHICGDGSVLDLITQIVDLTGDELIIKEYERMTELQVMNKPIKMGDLTSGDAVIVFSRRNALKYKRDLENLDFKVSIVYGRLSPEVRREQARKFDSGETDIIVSTDAIAMGMNLPIKRVVFTTLSKFINSKEYPISNSEIKQIAGRAGRYQRFPIGYATTLERVENGISMVEHAIDSELKQKENAMVGPDLDIFNKVNNALKINNLPDLKLSEFLRLFNTMTFKPPFYCVNLSEMIEIAEMVEQADSKSVLSSAEIFGFACAPVNLGLIEHVQYFIWILNNYVSAMPIKNEEVDYNSDNIDYLETSIKCVELYQWLARHFNDKNFDYVQAEILVNKSMAIEKLNDLLSEKIVLSCSSCGAKLPSNFNYNICESCFKSGKFRKPGFSSRKKSKGRGSSKKSSKGPGNSGKPRFKKKKSNFRGKKKFRS